MDKRSLAVGIVVGLLVLGCLGAVDGPEDCCAPPRFEFLDEISTNTNFLVLDTETGTVNQHDGSATFVYVFSSE